MPKRDSGARLRDLPQRLHLPSGRIVHLAPIDGDNRLSPDSSLLFADALALFEEKVKLTDEQRMPLPVGTLWLRDFHTLRAIAIRAGLLTEDPISVDCKNCEQSFEARPSCGLELGPFVDGELHDPELDAPFPFGEPQPIPEVTLGSSVMATATFVERTVDEARPLWRALARPDWDFDADIVTAMGLESLGDERRPTAIAEALSHASDAALDAILGLFDEAHYPPRLHPPVRCPECGAIDYPDAPVEREFPSEGVSSDTLAGEPFLDVNAFESRVRAIADEVYRDRGVTSAVNLVVDTGVPAIDDGGVPLLGSYVPRGEDPATGVMREAEVTLYYRTFRAMWEEEGAYDVDAELHETLDHELEHHLHYLAGHDPLDDAERLVIEDELTRFVGRRESGRRARAGFVADVGEFLRLTWPLWLLVALITFVAALAER